MYVRVGTAQGSQIALIVNELANKCAYAATDNVIFDEARPPLTC